MIKKYCFLIMFIFILSSVYSNENNEKMSSSEKITLQVHKEFDEMYPLHKKNFIFYRGNERISFDEFCTLSQDPYCLALKDKIKKIKVAGITSSSIWGVMIVSFFIPSVIYLAKKTSPYPGSNEYHYTGIAMIALTAFSVFGLILDVTVIFALLYKNKFNEQKMREAVDRYNNRLSGSNFYPDFGIVPYKGLYLGLIVK